MRFHARLRRIHCRSRKLIDEGVLLHPETAVQALRLELKPKPPRCESAGDRVAEKMMTKVLTISFTSGFVTTTCHPSKMYR